MAVPAGRYEHAQLCRRLHRRHRHRQWRCRGAQAISEARRGGVHDLAESIQRREISPTEIVDAYLRRIEVLNPRLSAYFTLTAESARKEARQAEAEIADLNKSKAASSAEVQYFAKLASGRAHLRFARIVS